MRIVMLAAAGLLLAGSAASATEVTETAAFKASASTVWKMANPDFCGIGTWHPAIEGCKLSENGTKRTLSLKGGGTIVEKRTAWNKKKTSYSYDIVESPLPVANYKSTFTVTPKGAKASEVTWSSTFEPKGASEDDAKKAIDGIYTSGLTALQGKM